MSGNQANDPLGRAVVARELGAAARVIEVARERRVSCGQLRAYAWREVEQHSSDAMPEKRVRGLGGVVQEAGDDELLIAPRRRRIRAVSVAWRSSAPAAPRYRAVWRTRWSTLEGRAGEEAEEKQRRSVYENPQE